MLERILRIITFLAGGHTVILGLMVIVGWHIGNRTLVQVLPDFVPMQYNTALGFVLSGAAIFSLKPYAPKNVLEKLVLAFLHLYNGVNRLA